MEYQVRIFWYQVYQARLWERMLNRWASHVMSTSILKTLPGKLDIRIHSPSILYIVMSCMLKGLIWVQTCCKGCWQMTLANKDLQ